MAYSNVGPGSTYTVKRYLEWIEAKSERCRQLLTAGTKNRKKAQNLAIAVFEYYFPYACFLCFFFSFFLSKGSCVDEVGLLCSGLLKKSTKKVFIQNTA